MQTKIHQINPVEYELEITATAEDLAPELEKAIRKQQVHAQMKGFRAGKVPLNLVKKVYGKAVAYQLIDDKVQKTYEKEILGEAEYDVLGQPKLTRLDYEPEGDLHAVIKFGIRPEVILKDMSQEELIRFVYNVKESDIDREIEGILKQHADLVPVEDGVAEASDLAVFDLQEVDAETRLPLIGKLDEDMEFFLDDPKLKDYPLLRSLCDSLVGKQAGDTYTFVFEHDQAHGEHEEGAQHAHHFSVTVKEIKRRDLPELNEDFVKELSKGRFEEVEALRQEIRKEIDASWQQRSKEMLEQEIMAKMLQHHEIPIPESVVEVYLDQFVEDVKERNNDKLPESFDEAAFRRQNTGEATELAKWMLIRDKVIQDHDLYVNNEDLDAYFEKEMTSGSLFTAVQLREFYNSMPQLFDNLKVQILNQKVFDTMAQGFLVVEKDVLAYAEEQKALANAGAEASPEA